MTDSFRNPPTQQAAPPFTRKQAKAIGTAMRYQFLSDVLLALSGVQIFGVSVFAGLADWAQALHDRADEIYLNAFNAQSSANYANYTLAEMFGTGLASDSGGVSISAIFNGSSSSTLSGFTRTDSGPGAGTFGPTGAGTAAWDKSGGLAYTLWDRNNTALTTDYQAVQILLAQPPQHPDIFGGQAYTWLLARCNSAATTFVYLRIGYNTIKVGCYNSGSNTAMTTGGTAQQVSLTANPGDVFTLLTGTDSDDYEIIVKRNGVIVWQDIDTGPASQMGASYRYVGVASEAAGRLVFTQTAPGELTGFSAADRLATSY